MPNFSSCAILTYFLLLAFPEIGELLVSLSKPHSLSTLLTTSSPHVQEMSGMHLLLSL